MVAIVNIERRNMSTNPMSALLADLALVVTQVFTWIGTISSTIVGDPLLLLTTGFLVLGGATSF